MKLRIFSLIAAIGASTLLAPTGSAQELPYQIFERYLEPLAAQIGMPGMSAVIVRNNRVEWEKGYGHADVENKVAATPDTLYPIGGVTQAMTAVLLGVCTDRHLLEVDTGIRTFVPSGRIIMLRSTRSSAGASKPTGCGALFKRPGASGGYQAADVQRFGASTCKPSFQRHCVLKGICAMPNPE